MKKFCLILGVAICAVNFAFSFGKKEEVWSTVEEFAPKTGTYAVKMVEEGSATVESFTSSNIEETSVTVTIKGTEDSSIVEMKKYFYKAKTTVQTNNENDYTTAKTYISLSGEKGFTFDDSTLTITRTQSATEKGDHTTYAKFCSESITNGFTIEKSSLGNWRLTFTYTSDGDATTEEDPVLAEIQSEFDNYTYTMTMTLK